MRFSSLVSFSLGPLLVFACSSSSSSSSGANPSDAAADTTASNDGSSGGVDSSNPDAGEDATDDQSIADTGPLDDGNRCPNGLTTPAFAGCVEADAGVDASSPNVFIDYGAADAAIDFSTDNLDITYTPRCVKIAAGHSVNWAGSFSVHPLVPAHCNPPAGTKIPKTSTGTSVTVKFNVPGVYGYYCGHHGSSGASADAMNGVIVVY